MAHKFSAVTSVTKKTLVTQCRRFSAYFQPSESEYVDTPVYPPILDLSKEGIRRKKIEDYDAKMKSIPTVEEKLLELNAEKYYGWWACNLQEVAIPYNTLPFVQFATRTHLAQGLPLFYQQYDEVTNKLVSVVKDKLSELTLQEFEYVVPRTNKFGETRSVATEEDRRTKNFIPQLNRLLSSLMAPENQHLVSTEVDWEPRVEAFWWVGGIEPGKMLETVRKNNPRFEDDVHAPINRALQYYGDPVITLRHENPLPQFIDRESGLSIEGSVPQWHLDPRVLGLKFKRQHATNIPGFWPGTRLQHGYLAFLKRGALKLRDGVLKGHDHQEGLHCQAVMHSFGWAFAQACYLGFGPFTELTYPISTQTIITNGQYYSFYAYQLNTCALHDGNSGDANPHRNVCFGTDEMKLYDVIENGQLKGLNEDVLKNLIKFYLVQPVEPQVELRPYLSPEHRYAADLKDVKRRKTIETNFKYLFSNRPRAKPMDEVYHWEKIYKIDHDTRPMEPRRRFFERKEPLPIMRRLDDFEPPYVPKALREVPKKSRRGRLPVQKTIKL